MKFLSALIITFFLISAVARGEEAPAKPLTLEDCIKISLENNSSIKLSNYSTLDAQAKVDEAYTQFLPKLKGKASYLRYDSVPTSVIPGIGEIPMGTRNNTNLSLELTQPLFTGGRIKNSYDITKSAYSIAKQEGELEKKDIVKEVTEKYFQALKAKKFVEIAQSSNELLSSHLKDVENFYSAGMVSKNDILSVSVSLASSQNLLIRARNSYELAKSSMNYSLNQDVNTPLELKDIDKNDVSYKCQLEECFKLASTNREELGIIKDANKINEAGINIEKSAYYPQIYFIGSYAESGEDFPLRNENFSALFTMELNIFNWWETSYKVQSAKLALKKSQENESVINNSIRLEVKAAYLQVKQTEEEINATNKAVEQAEENYRIYKEKFAVNAATSTEILDAENLLLNSKINYFQALYDFHIAKVNLKRAIGEIN